MKTKPYSLHRLNGAVIRIAICLTAMSLSNPALRAQNLVAHSNWPGPGQLFVGTCYQPVDRTPEVFRNELLRDQY